MKTIYFISFIGICLSFFSCSQQKDKREFATVKLEPFIFEGMFRGDFKAKNSTSVHVPNLPGGASMTIDFVEKDGTKVKEGDVILRFLKDTMESELRVKENDFEIANARFDKVRLQQSKEGTDLALKVKRKDLELKRSELQIVQGVSFISDLELKKAKLDVEKAKIELELAKKALRTFRKKKATALKIEKLQVDAAQRKVDEKKKGLGLVEVKAPVDGVIYAPLTRLNWQRTKALPGVVARSGDKVLEIPDLSSFEIEIYARQRDAVLISVGDEAKITPTIFPEIEIKGRVKKKEEFATTRNERFGTKSDEGNLKEFLIIVEMESSPKELKPGNTGRVSIRSKLADKALLIPLAAIHENEKGSFVILEKGESRSVKVGRSNLTHGEILEGLDEGTKVQLGEDFR